MDNCIFEFDRCFAEIGEFCLKAKFSVGWVDLIGYKNVIYFEIVMKQIDVLFGILEGCEELKKNTL